MIIHNVVCWGSHGKQENIVIFPILSHRNMALLIRLFDTENVYILY